MLTAADVAFVNLESVLSDQGGVTRHSENPLIFCGPPRGAGLLRRAGIDVVSLTNNHAWDYGKSALFETLNHLRQHDIVAVGAVHRQDALLRPVVVRKGGWSTAWFAVTDIWNQDLARHPGRKHVTGADVASLEPALRTARSRHDLVFVSYHGGSEYIPYALERTRRFVRAVMRAGADAVFGHHPHVPHGVGWYGSKPAFYSLGNLLFPAHKDHRWTRIGYLAKLTYSSGDAPRVEVCPHRLHGGEPHPLAGPADQQRFTRHLRWLSASFGGTQVHPPDEQGCSQVTPLSQRVPMAMR